MDLKHKSEKKGERPKKVLFIEDEPDQLMMVRLRLERNGLEVITAQDGPEGLNKALSESPDLILLDIVIPGMDGFEVCKRLKKDPKTKNIPVITTTAAGHDDIEQLCLLCGAEDCVRKPYDSKELVSKINSYLAA